MAMKGKTPERELLALGDAYEFHVEQIRVPMVAADRCIVWITRSPEASARS